MKKNYIKIAGIINLITAIIHLVAGQIDLINPLIESTLNNQVKGELIGAWHIVSILFFITSYLLIKAGIQKGKENEIHALKTIGIIYSLIGIPFIITSIWFSIFAPQWILLMPIGVLTLLGTKQEF